MKIILLDKIDKKILLLDSLGAVVTAINLLVIPQFESYTGIPRDIALILVPLPILYSIFSFFRNCDEHGTEIREDFLHGKDKGRPGL